MDGAKGRPVSRAAAIGIALGLAGCTGGEEGAVLRIARSATGEGTRAALRAAMDAFERGHPGLGLRLIEQENDQYENLGLASLLAGAEPPDIYFEWAGDRVRRKLEAGLAADLASELDRGGWRERFLPGVLDRVAEACGGEGLVPLSFDISNLFFYNREIFAKLALEPPRTWAALLELCARIEAAGIVPIGIGNRSFWAMGNLAAHMASRVVGEARYARVLRRERGTTLLEFEPALARIGEWARRGFLDPSLNARDDLQSMMVFFQGGFAIHPTGSWLVQRARDDAPDFAYGFFNLPPLPEAKGDPTSLIVCFTGYAIHPRSPRRDRAVAFLRELSSPRAQARFVRAGVMTTVRGAAEGVEVDPAYAAMARLAGRARTFVAPPDTGFSLKVADAFYSAVAEVADGSAAAREALERAEVLLGPPEGGGR